MNRTLQKFGDSILDDLANMQSGTDPKSLPIDAFSDNTNNLFKSWLEEKTSKIVYEDYNRREVTSNLQTYLSEMYNMCEDANTETEFFNLLSEAFDKENLSESDIELVSNLLYEMNDDDADQLLERLESLVDYKKKIVEETESGRRAARVKDDTTFSTDEKYVGKVVQNTESGVKGVVVAYDDTRLIASPEDEEYYKQQHPKGRLGRKEFHEDRGKPDVRVSIIKQDGMPNFNSSVYWDANEYEFTGDFVEVPEHVLARGRHERRALGRQARAKHLKRSADDIRFDKAKRDTRAPAAIYLPNKQGKLELQNPEDFDEENRPPRFKDAKSPDYWEDDDMSDDGPIDIDRELERTWGQMVPRGRA
jgi:hypothetical protein